MAKKQVKKVIVIALDGASYGFVKKFSKEGKMPHITRLAKKGFLAEALPSPPCDTPTNWASIMTGAWAGTHGLTSFFVHFPGEPLDKTYATTTSEVCDAEYLWDVAERKGKRCILLNYPVSWPPTIKKGIVINGTGPVCARWRISYANVYSTGTEEKKREVKIIYGEEFPVTFKEANGWRNLPKSYSPPLEAAIPLKGRLTYRWSEIGWELDKTLQLGKEPLSYNILLVDSKGRGYDKVIISRDKDAAEALTVLKQGEWSDWIYETFEKEEMLTNLVKIKGDKVKGVFKFKLVQLSPDAKTFILYRTDIWITEGWAYPEKIAEDLNSKVGPFTEGLEIPPPITRYHEDWETYFEQLDRQVEWFSEAAEYLSKRYRWDLLIVQIHVQDGINHVISREVYPKAPEYDPQESRKYWERFQKSYTAVDRLVGEITKRCADEETLVTVVSDHGALPTIKRAWVSGPLIRAGLLSYKKDEKSGKMVVDWSRTKAFPRRTYIWVNLKGRDPEGIVEPREFELVRDGIITALYSMRDPETGECPVEAILRKEDAQVLGQWGDKVGDLMYFLKPGYTDADIEYERIDPDVMQAEDIGSTMVGCAHHQYLPTATLDHFSNSGIFVMGGPGVKKGYDRGRPIWLVDVAPTIAYLLGIPAPKHTEGNVIWDALER